MDSIDFLIKEGLIIFTIIQLNKIKEAGLVLCLISRINKNNKLIAINEKLYAKKDYHKKIKDLNRLKLETKFILLNDPNDLNFTFQYLFGFYLANFGNKVNMINNKDKFNKKYIKKILKTTMTAISQGGGSSNVVTNQKSSSTGSKSDVPDSFSNSIVQDDLPFAEVIGDVVSFESECKRKEDCGENEDCLDFNPTEEDEKKNPEARAGKFCTKTEKLKISSVNEMNSSSRKKVRMAGTKGIMNLNHMKCSLLILILLSMVGSSGAVDPVTAAGTTVVYAGGTAAGAAALPFVAVAVVIGGGVMWWKDGDKKAKQAHFDKFAQETGELIKGWGGAGLANDPLATFTKQQTKNGIVYYTITENTQKMIESVRHNILRSSDVVSKELLLSLDPEHTEVIYGTLMKAHVDQYIDLMEHIDTGNKALKNLVSSNNRNRKDMKAADEAATRAKAAIEYQEKIVSRLTLALDDIMVFTTQQSQQRTLLEGNKGVTHDEKGLYFKFKEFRYIDENLKKLQSEKTIPWNMANTIPSGKIDHGDNISYFKSGIDFLINHEPEIPVENIDGTFSIFRLCSTELDELEDVKSNVENRERERKMATAVATRESGELGRVNIAYYNSKKSNKARKEEDEATMIYELKNDLLSINVNAYKGIKWSGEKKHKTIEVTPGGWFSNEKKNHNMNVEEKEIDLHISFIIPLLHGIATTTEQAEGREIENIKAITVNVDGEDKSYYNPVSHQFHTEKITGTFRETIINGVRNSNGYVIGGTQVDFEKFNMAKPPTNKRTISTDIQYRLFTDIADKWFKPVGESDYDHEDQRNTFNALLGLVEQTTSEGSKITKSWFIPDEYEIPGAKFITEKEGEYTDWKRNIEIAEKEFVSLLTGTYTTPEEKARITKEAINSVKQSDSPYGKWEKLLFNDDNPRPSEMEADKPINLVEYIQKKTSELKNLYKKGENGDGQNYIEDVITSKFQEDEKEFALIDEDKLIAPILKMHSDIVLSKVDKISKEKIFLTREKQDEFGKSMGTVWNLIRRQNRKTQLLMHSDKGGDALLKNLIVENGGGSLTTDEVKTRLTNLKSFVEKYNKNFDIMVKLFNTMSTPNFLHQLTSNLISPSEGIVYNYQTFKGMPLTQENRIRAPLKEHLEAKCIDTNTLWSLNEQYYSAINCLQSVYDLKKKLKGNAEKVKSVANHDANAMKEMKAIKDSTNEMEELARKTANGIDLVITEHQRVVLNQVKKAKADSTFGYGFNSPATTKEKVLTTHVGTMKRALPSNMRIEDLPMKLLNSMRGGIRKKISRKANKKKKVKSLKIFLDLKNQKNTKRNKTKSEV